MPTATAVSGQNVRGYTGPTGDYSTTDKGQRVSVDFPKDLYAPMQRLGITAKDTPDSGTFDPSALTQFGTLTATGLWVCPASDTPVATISLDIACFLGGTLLAVIRRADLTFDSGSTYLKSRYPSVGEPVFVDLPPCDKVALVVTAVTSGSSWDVTAVPY